MALYDQESYPTLEEIIEVLEKGQFPDMHWVAKNYSKGALIEDLKAIQEKMKENK